MQPTLPISAVGAALAALFLGAAVTHAEAPASNLPDLGAPATGGGASIRPGANGVTLEYTFDQKKVSVSPEYSNQTGLSLGAAFAALLSERAAVGLVFSAGSDKKEALVNAGFRLDDKQRLILSAGQLRQSLDYAFPSGTERVETSQNSGGMSYQYQLGQGILQSLEVNGYLSETASRDLGAKNFAVDTATLYELWSDPRRIAGGRVSGFQGRLGLSPFAGSLVKISFGQERLSYDLLTGRDGMSRATGGVEWLQQLNEGFQFKLGAETFASQNRVSVGLEKSFAGVDGRHNFGVAFASLRGRDGVGNDDQVKLTYSYAFGSRSGFNPTIPPAGPDVGRDSSRQAVGRVSTRQVEQVGLKPDPQNALLDQVVQRPSFIPSHVVARIDTTAAPTRLIAVDKTTLPAGASVNTTTGDVTVPLAVAVTGIAGITKNLAGFTNGGQFSLNGNSLVVKPSLIVQPAVGVVDSYVVTLNNSGGGTTLATVSVSHGSVKVDSIVVSAGDVTAPVTTVAPAVSGTTQTGATFSVTINEAGTGYYLVRLATAAPPTVAEVMAANNAFTMAANVAATQAITGLTLGTDYKIYFVAKDGVNNVQAAVQSVAFTTASNLPAGYITQGGLTWTPNTVGSAAFGGDFYNWGIPGGYATWTNANAFCASHSVNGLTGWRLPTKDELVSLYNSGALNGVPGWALYYTWSATASAPGNHYGVGLGSGIVFWYGDDWYYFYVTCVR